MSNTENHTNQELPFLLEDNTKEIRTLRSRINALEHDLFFLYVFLASQDICDEACAFLEDRAEDLLPFRLSD